MNRDTQRGHRIKEERKRLGLTQKEAAEIAGVSREMFSRYESGASPGQDVWSAMAKGGFRIDAIRGYHREQASHTPFTLGEIREPVVHLHDRGDGLSWREVLIIVIDELQRAGLQLPGEKIARLTDLLMNYQSLGVTVDSPFIKQQIRLVA